MKSLATILSTAAVLAVVVATAGFTLDVAVLLSIGAASCLVGMFVRDYSHVPRYDLDAAKAPARDRKRARPVEAGVEFATFASFNSTIS